jgi:hypothetical protein
VAAAAAVLLIAAAVIVVRRRHRPPGAAKHNNVDMQTAQAVVQLSAGCAYQYQQPMYQGSKALKGSR